MLTGFLTRISLKRDEFKSITQSHSITSFYFDMAQNIRGIWHTNKKTFGTN